MTYECWFPYKGVDFVVMYEGDVGEQIIGALYLDSDPEAQDIWDMVTDEVQDKAFEEVSIHVHERGIE